jgi:hypothetical protein
VITAPQPLADFADAGVQGARSLESTECDIQHGGLKVSRKSTVHYNTPEGKAISGLLRVLSRKI